MQMCPRPSKRLILIITDRFGARFLQIRIRHKFCSFFPPGPIVVTLLVAKLHPINCFAQHLDVRTQKSRDAGVVISVYTNACTHGVYSGLIYRMRQKRFVIDNTMQQT